MPIEELGQDTEEVGRCPWCGERGVGFADADPPSDYCGHDPALVRRTPPQNGWVTPDGC